MRSQALVHAATQAENLAQQVSRESDFLRDDIASLNTAHSPAFQALRSTLDSTKGRLADTHQQVTTVASILRSASVAARLLEEYLAMVSAFIGIHPFAQTTYSMLQGMGKALDIACAQAIESVCTPLMPPSPLRLIDEPHLPLDALHTLAMSTAPPHIRELAEKHDDLRLIELPDGGLVAAIGDIDEASSVVTFVAGLHSSDPAGWDKQIANTRNLATATGGAGIVWLGYQAPSSLTGGLRQAPARHAGSQLADFQRALSQRNPKQRRIVVGYSYGSAVAGHAAVGESGLHADELVFVGSPGVPARHVSELTLHGKGPQVHAFTTPTDPISFTTGPRTGTHGTDPASYSFGANVWKTGLLGDHGMYFDDPRAMDVFARELAP